MKIDRVETAWIEIDCPEPQGLSGSDITRSTDALCRITTSDGLRGIGEGRGAPLAEICSIMHELFTPLLVGENALHTRYLWEKLFQATLDSKGEPKRGLNPAAVRGALCAVDLALWDIKAKAANVSVCELLGGKPHPVPAYIQKGFYVPGESLNKMADEAVRGLEAGGYGYLKMRIGRNGTREARERVSVMREALGDDIGLMVDVNQAWHLDEAVEGAKALEPYNLTWYEDPIARKPRTGSPSQSAENFDWNGELGELAGRIPRIHRGVLRQRETASLLAGLVYRLPRSEKGFHGVSGRTGLGLGDQRRDDQTIRDRAGLGFIAVPTF